MEGRGLSIELTGAFKLTDATGGEISVTGRNARRLLAILARSPEMRCSRVTLREMIWETADEGVLGNRLRQLTNDVRKRLGAASSHLGADNDALWLEKVEETSDANQAYFDIDGGPVLYEDWRAGEANRSLPAPTPSISSDQGPPAISAPTVCLYFPEAEAEDTAELQGAATIAFRDAFAGSDFVALMETSENAAELGVSFHDEGQNWRVSLTLRHRQRVLWSHSATLPAAMRRAERFNALLEIAFLALATVEKKLGDDMRSASRQLLYPAVAQLFSFAPDKVLLAEQALGGLEGRIDTGTMLAWKAFARMLQAGERLVGERAPAEQKAEALISEALGYDSGNPTVLAVAAQFFAFVHRDYVLAREFAQACLRVAPYGALPRDVAAMIEIYDDNAAAASEHAHFAQKHAAQTPLQPYADATKMMLSALQGDHDGALRAANTILAFRPRFLPVQRHAVASLIHLNRIEEARALTARTREADPDFATSAMFDPAYSLPSGASRQLIISALRRAGLFDEGN